MFPLAVRATAAFGLLGLSVGGLISAVRREEIYVICPIIWCKEVAAILQSAGLASWSLGLLLVGVSLLVAYQALVGTLLVSLIVLFLPHSRMTIILAALEYVFLAIAIGLPLCAVYTNADMAALFKNANGPLLSEYYIALPLLFSLCGVLFVGFYFWLSTHLQPRSNK